MLFHSIITLIVSEHPMMQCWFSWWWSHDRIWSLSRLFGSLEVTSEWLICTSLRVGCREALFHIEILFWTWSVSPPADKCLLFMHMNACNVWSLYQSHSNADSCGCKCSVITQKMAESFSSLYALSSCFTFLMWLYYISLIELYIWNCSVFQNGKKEQDSVYIGDWQGQAFTAVHTKWAAKRFEDIHFIWELVVWGSINDCWQCNKVWSWPMCRPPVGM